MSYGDFKDLLTRTASDKVLLDKVFTTVAIASNPKYDGYQNGILSIVYNFFDTKAQQTGTGISENQDFAIALHKSITKKYQRRKIYSSYQDNNWGADVGDLQLTCKYNNKVIDICNK